MKKINYFILLLIFLLGLANLTYAKENSLDQMVAIVNDDIITKSELNDAVNIVKMQMQQQGMSLPATKTLQKQVLDQLINKRLQLQIIQQANIKVDNTELNRAIATIAKQNNMTITEFYQRLASEGMNKKVYEKEMREQLAIQKLQQAEIINRIQISPQEVKAFAKTLAQENTQVTNIYRVQDILIPLSDEPSEKEIAEATKTADRILQKIKSNPTVTTITQSYPTVKVTDFGNKLLSDIPSAFADAVKSLKKNEIAGPIQTGNGLHLVRLMDLKVKKENAETPSSSQIENKLVQHKFEEALQVWLAKIHGQAYILNKLDEA